MENGGHPRCFHDLHCHIETLRRNLTSSPGHSRLLRLNVELQNLGKESKNTGRVPAVNGAGDLPTSGLADKEGIVEFVGMEASKSRSLHQVIVMPSTAPRKSRAITMPSGDIERCLPRD